MRISIGSHHAPMTDTIAMHGHDIIDPVSNYPGGIRQSPTVAASSKNWQLTKWIL